MAKEGFFQKMKNFLFGESEEAISDFSQPEEADVSIQDAEISEIPSFKFSPTTVGTTDAPAEFYPHRVDEGREAPDIPEQYRVEHEPYRYEPDGDGTVCISKAHLYEMHPKNLLCVDMYALSPLKIKANGNCVVYSEFNTDEQGKVIADPDNPDGGLYRLAKSATLPNSIQFELPDENDANGKEGKYYVPIVWVKNSKLYRHQWNEETDGREARLYGGLEGIRGPLHWHRGYNKIKNLGDGKNVYRKYIRNGKDEKEFRSIDERAQTGLSSPFTGEAQVRVKYSDDVQDQAEEIHVTGNEVNEYWKIGGKGVAIVEDGLVTCLKDLECEELPPVALNKTTVLSGVSLGSTSVLNITGSVTVALEPDSSNMTSVVASSSVTTVAAPVTAGNLSDIFHISSVHTELTAAPTTSANLVSVLGSAVTTSVAATTTSANLVSVLGSAVTTSVAATTTSANLVSVLGSAVTTEVAAITTSANLVSVLGSAVTTEVAATTTSANLVSVLGSAVTATVAAPTTTGDTASVVGGVGTTPVALAPDATADKVDVWRGGSSTAAGGLAIVKVASCGNTGGSGDTCYWVMGVEATGAYESSAPTFPALITGASYTSVVKSLSTTSVVNTTTPTTVLKSVPTITVIGSGSPVNVLGSVPTTTVISSVSPVNVLGSVPTTTVISSVSPVNVLGSVPTTTVISSVNATSVLGSVPTTTVISSVNATSVLGSVPTHVHVYNINTTNTSVVTSTTDRSVIASGSPVSVVASLNTVSVDTLGSTSMSVLTGSVTTEVYAPTGTLHKTVLESPSSNSASEPVKVVKCPSSHLCPEPE